MNIQEIRASMEALKVDVAAVRTVAGSTKVLILGMADRLDTLAATVNAMVGGGAIAAELNQMSSELRAAQGDLSEATTRGTVAMNESADEAAAGDTGGDTGGGGGTPEGGEGE